MRGVGILPTRWAWTGCTHYEIRSLSVTLCSMLLTARNLSKSYGPRLLFAGITLGIEEGDRVGLIGANGSGKSTLLRIFAGLETPDDGEIITRRQLRASYVAQEDELDPALSCLATVAAAVDKTVDEHDRRVRAEILLDRAGFAHFEALASTLSGGWRKRLAIVRQLAREPDLLLIDEPTNHLDIEGIEWLESFISTAPFATLTVSHDRQFLEGMANRVIELNKAYPDGFLGHRGAYSEFIEKREAFLIAQKSQEQALASGVRREIEWLQRGAKARTTKAKGRIERAGDMMSDLADLRTRNQLQGAAQVDFSASDRRTKKLIELKAVSKSRNGRRLFEGVDLTLAPGKKLGLLGPNGSGKSTMIGLLTGTLEADSGTIFRAPDLRVVVFDQHREQLDQTDTLRHALSPMGDTLIFQGQPLHVSGWARKFLFRTEQLDLPISELSGGEQARVLIARLMLREADVLILDEPTNDLDIPTLDVLENSLNGFAGAMILVTHDRYLLDRVSTELLALDGEGNANLYANLTQWEQARQTRRKTKAAAKKSQAANIPFGTATPTKKKKLPWNEQKELDGMEAAIAAAELEVVRHEAHTVDPSIQSDHLKLHAAYDQLGAAQREIERLYARWTELEAKLSA